MPCAKSDVFTTAWQPNVKSFTSQHGDRQEPWLGKALGFTFAVHTVQESHTRRGFWKALSNSRCEDKLTLCSQCFPFRHLLGLAPFGERLMLRPQEGQRSGVAPFPLLFRGGSERKEGA